MSSEWYVLTDGEEYGPYSAAILKQCAAEGRIDETTQVKNGKSGRWVAAQRVKGLFAPSSMPPTSPHARPLPQCPHCQAAIRCDDRFAGQVVLCPTCKKQLQMPAVAQPLPGQASARQPEPSPEEQQNFTWTPAETQGSSTRHPTSRSHTSRRKKTDPTPYIVGGGGMFVVLVVVILFTTGNPFKSASDTRVVQKGDKAESSKRLPDKQEKVSTAPQKSEEERRRKEEADRLQRERQAEQESKQRELDLQLQQARESRRNQIRDRLQALPEEHQRKVETLLKSIALLNSHITDVELRLRRLQSRINELQVDIGIGRAFGGGGGGGGGPQSREAVLNECQRQHREHSADLSRSKAELRNAEDQLSMLKVT